MQPLKTHLTKIDLYIPKVFERIVKTIRSTCAYIIIILNWIILKY